MPSTLLGGPQDSAEEAMRRRARKQILEARKIKASPRGLEKWVGKVVKKRFATTDTSFATGEWMWVQVLRVEGGRLVGRLDNDPVCCDLRYNDVVSLDESEIIAVCVD
jgi:hypothetical protein